MLAKEVEKLIANFRQKLDTSERRTCKTVGMARSSQQYKPRTRTDDEALRLALIRLAKQYGRYGYRKIAKLLRIEGWKINHKKDEYTREALAVDAKPKMGNAEVLESLYPLILKRGKPEFVRSDNGKEFTALALQDWLKKIGVKPIQIYPGSPWENGYNERFNGTLRSEVLNAEWFATIDQARTVIGKWLRQYNHIRPHQALGMRPPVPETI